MNAYTRKEFGLAAKFVKQAENSAKNRRDMPAERANNILKKAERVQKLSDRVCNPDQKSAAMARIFQAFKEVQKACTHAELWPDAEVILYQEEYHTASKTACLDLEFAYYDEFAGEVEEDAQDDYEGGSWDDFGGDDYFDDYEQEEMI